MGTESTKNALFYRLSFGNIIAYKGQQPPTLQLKQGSQKVISDGSKSYYLLLRGVKVNRQIYQPIEIEAELDMMQTTTDASRQEARTAPQFEDIRGLLLQREVDIDILEVEGNIDSTRTQDYKNIYNIAKNCYVYEMTPHDLLNDLTKTFHKECQVNLDATYAELQLRLLEPYTKMSPAEVDEARQGFENVFNKAKETCDKLLQLKLNEIEEGYQRYLAGENDQYNEPDADDDEMEISHDAEIEALFS